MPDQIPDHLQSDYRRLTDSVAELDTLIARANQIPIPVFEPVNPAQLAEAAEKPNAAPELRAVARAVAEGRISWVEVASGGGRSIPEVRDLHSAGADSLARELEAQQATASSTSPRQGRLHRTCQPDEDDYAERTFLRRVDS